MIEKIRNMFNIPELRGRILFTFGVVFRLNIEVCGGSFVGVIFEGGVEEKGEGGIIFFFFRIALGEDLNGEDKGGGEYFFLKRLVDEEERPSGANFFIIGSSSVGGTINFFFFFTNP